MNYTCKHQVNISMCKIHNCANCEYHNKEEQCPFAQNESVEDCQPTFQQMMEVYKKGNAGRLHQNSVINSVTADLGKVGLTINSKFSEMTRMKFKNLIEILSLPKAGGEVLHGETIASHLAAFRSLTSEWLEDIYTAQGLELPVFSIPKYKVERRPVQEISDRTIRKVEIQMERWLASGKQSDRNAYMLAFFALYCGMRAGDICNAKWDILQNTPIGILIVYQPHKTMHSSGAKVSFKLNNKTFCKIEPYIGNPDEYIIPRHEDRIPKYIRERQDQKGDCVGMHSNLRKKVNKMLSECGIGNEYRGQKKIHALRKYFATERVFEVGRQQAANECGHTIQFQGQSYLGSLAAKVA